MWEIIAEINQSINLCLLVACQNASQSVCLSVYVMDRVRFRFWVNHGVSDRVRISVNVGINIHILHILHLHPHIRILPVVL